MTGERLGKLTRLVGGLHDGKVAVCAGREVALVVIAPRWPEIADVPEREATWDELRSQYVFPEIPERSET